MFEIAEGGNTEREEACQSQPNGPSGPDDGDGIMIMLMMVVLMMKMVMEAAQRGMSIPV